MCKGRKAQKLRNWKRLSTEKQTVCWKKNSSESPGSSYIKGLPCFFLHPCTPFKIFRNASSHPSSLGETFPEDVSQLWPHRDTVLVFVCFLCQLQQIAQRSPSWLCQESSFGSVDEMAVFKYLPAWFIASDNQAQRLYEGVHVSLLSGVP